MKLAIQIILYNSSGHLAPLLDSLKAQTFKDVEVFFYDNSELVSEVSSSRQVIDASGLPHRFVAAEKNIGFAGGHVEMYRLHDAPFVMLLNDDAKLEASYLEHAMKRIESDPKIGSVTGLVYRWDGETIDTTGLEYPCMARIRDRFAGESVAHRSSFIVHNGEVFGVSGAIGLYRRSAIDKAGGLFDPAWFMYKEDVDLAIRLKRAGFSAWFEPKAVAWHKRGLKEDRKGWMARLVDEHKRPALLRQHAYINQHRVYTLHAAPALGFKDFFLSLVNELGRTFLVFVTSPIVWIRSVFTLAVTFPTFWKRRKELEKLGLPHRRMLV